VPEGVVMSYDGPTPHACPWCGVVTYKRRKFCCDDCMRASKSLLMMKIRGRKNKGGPAPKLTELERALASTSDSECYHCSLLHDCRRIVKKGRPVLCQPEGVAPIPVVGFEVTSVFDGISLTMSVWEEA